MILTEAEFAVAQAAAKSPTRPGYRFIPATFALEHPQEFEELKAKGVLEEAPVLGGFWVKEVGGVA